MLRKTTLRAGILILGLAATLAAQAEQPVATRAGRLFDGKSDRLLANQVVLVQGAELSRSGRPTAFKPLRGAA